MSTIVSSCDTWTGNSPKSFMPVLTIPYGKYVCALDGPSNVMNLTGVGGFTDIAQCAMQCTRDDDCSGFNLKTQLCEMYSYIPSWLSLVPGCEYRQVSSQVSSRWKAKMYMLCLWSDDNSNSTRKTALIDCVAIFANPEFHSWSVTWFSIPGRLSSRSKVRRFKSYKWKETNGGTDTTVSSLTRS